MTLGSFGFNLNAAVGDFLQPFYNKVEIKYYRYIGEEERKGEFTPQYSAPVTMIVNQQVPGSGALQKVGKINDSKIVQQFWGSFEVLPISRIDDRGGDMIEYDGAMWYVIEAPDDFRQVGWMSVLAVKTTDPVPEAVNDEG